MSEIKHDPGAFLKTRVKNSKCVFPTVKVSLTPPPTTVKKRIRVVQALCITIHRYYYMYRDSRVIIVDVLREIIRATNFTWQLYRIRGEIVFVDK